MVKKVFIVFGTRPEAIKMAPVVMELKKHPKKFRTVVCVTAQHRQMLDDLLDLFNIKPDYDLNIMQENQSPFEVTQLVLKRIKPVLLKEKPDIVLVQGDTTTTMATALAAYYLKIKVGHIEAGLRTNDKYAPFPEEINRRITTVIADYHFAPTKRARENLLKEGIPAKNIFVTGNTVIDALFYILRKTKNIKIPVLEKIRPDKKIILLTCHRRESFGRPIVEIFRAVHRIAEKRKDVEIIYPVHPNPNVKILAYKMLGKLKNVHLIPPVRYDLFCHLMKNAYLILTDSGGIQEEAPSLGKPVLVLREVTERPEAIEAGTSRIVGMDRNRILRETFRLLNNKRLYSRMSHIKNPFGDGKSSLYIKQAITHNNLKNSLTLL
ncbi:MAG: UDP-N-acetylglucosamine 2-epimerase (non-hydrolyzing) [candidate division WOR-3 bacterium]